MSFDPTLAAFRFGTGLSPHHPAPAVITDIMAELVGDDVMAALHRIPPYAQAAPSLLALQEAGRARNAANGTDQQAAAEAYEQTIKDLARTRLARNLAADIARMVDAPVGFLERLAHFWADHFTAKARTGSMRHLVSPYIEEAIRPHIAGRFSDMLQAVTLHPIMLIYLQQIQSVGPNSAIGLRQAKGLNENLARELLELHTLGVGGPYTQADVTQMAELLSGLTYHQIDGVVFNARRAEPGSETILGETYSADPAISTITDALDDLARHPATAAHLARKLAVHFVSDTPDEGLVTALSETFLATDGDLLKVARTLLDHPAAWAKERAKVRSPLEFIAGSLRALGMTGAQIMALDDQTARGVFDGPLRVMGQPWQRPLGPDGWPEAPDDWIIPQTMAARISWAMRRPERLLPTLPDPREFVITALGPAPDQAVSFAASAAASTSDGIGVILSSSAFQRR
ncbi:DUF1800 domain-containing protein [Yoonia sp. 208BN28-4]|uniref:DUF1800 domain-containing protein n=1 Tax=Yoonia sp. 208BN28-4 TaxID=3126505 RepID=UPI00309DB6C1